MKTDPSTPPRRRPALRRIAAGLAVPAALATLLAACSTGAQNYIYPTPDDIRVAHPITIDERLKTMDVPVGLDTARLSAPVKGNIAAFGRRFNDSGSSVVAIVAPLGSPNEVAAAGISRQVRDVLVGAGVAPETIDFRSYSAGSKETGAPIRIAYSAIAASVEGCGEWPDRLETNFHNRNYKNFGCATQANLAAMVDNPLDLLYPRDMAPADAGRRATVLDKYRSGERYSALQQLENGQIAQGVGN